MKSEFFEFIGNARKKRSDKFQHQLYIFIVCLIISSFIWALIRLSKDYYYTLHYRLNYTQIPANLKMVSASDTMLTIKIRLQGFGFFSEQFFFPSVRSHDVSLENIKLRYHDSKITGMMLTHAIGKEIATETNFPSEVYFVTPDTLSFVFNRSHSSSSKKY